MKRVYSSPEALDVTRLKIAVVTARFNRVFTDLLMAGATAAWQRHGGDVQALFSCEVPGAFELPLACNSLALTGKYDAIVALGCVIRGDTPHFEYVSSEAARGIMEVGLKSNIPVIFGVLTVDTIEQADERANPERLNKGGEAMDAAIEMANLVNKILPRGG